VATLGLYTINDVKAANYLPPFTSMNNQTAIRQFSTAIMQEGHDFNNNAEDYSLWRIGDYDTETTIIEQGNKELLANAHDIKSQITLAQ